MNITGDSRLKYKRDMEQTGFLACIDFGTSSITGLLGRRNEQDVISIIASESIPSDSSVKHGIVYNIDEAAGKIKKILSLLENKAGKKIGKVYVSVAGMSLKTIEHIQTQRLAPGTPVSFAMIDRMEEQARMNRPSLLSNYGVVSPEVFLDSVRVEDYLEKPASTIEVRYRQIAGRPNIKVNLQRCFVEKNRIDIAGYIVGPVATGAILLDEEDKNKGCALVDFGAGTTTISVYKDGLLRFMSVVPFGGRTITKDIQSLGISAESAEAYKLRYGRVGKDKSKDAAKGSIGDSSVDVRELNKIIQLRQEEIVLNVINQINESGYVDELEGGIIMTGGASQMKGLSDYLSEKSKMAVKQGAIKRLYINNAIDLLQNPSYSQCLGLMLFAKENCEKIEAPKVDYTVNTGEPQQEAPSGNTTDKAPEDKTEDNKGQEDKNKGGKNNTKKDGRQRSIFDFLQNVGGAIFKDEQ